MLVLLAVLLCAVPACGSLPPSAFARAEKLHADLQPVLTTALFALGGHSDERLVSAFDAVGALLSAYSHGDAKRFDLMLPCVAAALVNVAALLPKEQAQAVRGVAGILRGLAPEAVCKPPSLDDDEDAGARLEMPAEVPAYVWRVGRLQVEPQPPLDLCRDSTETVLRAIHVAGRARVWA